MWLSEPLGASSVAAAFGEAPVGRVAAVELVAALERVAAAVQGILPAVRHRNRVLSLEKATVLRARSRARAYRYLRFIIAVFIDVFDGKSMPNVTLFLKY